MTRSKVVWEMINLRVEKGLMKFKVEKELIISFVIYSIK
jgi:hypothetical protein